jgi:predicted MPP superfamily phosphohydrolase
VVSAVAGLQPDLIVATGDIVDAEIDHLDGLSQRFASLQPPLGKYAVTGNHEFYAGIKPALDFLGRSGFAVLRGTAVSPRPGLVLAGVDDPVAGGGDEIALLPLAPRDFTVLLKHRPLLAAGSLGRFDLQLSGHAHRGQIFPFNLLTGLTFPMQDGLYRLGGESWLYTSRGTGTWGPPMRLFSPPEITLFEIVGTGAAPGPG